MKIGDIVELITPACGLGWKMSAQLGATAIVVEEFDGKYITVKWLDALSNGQCDGRYYPAGFKVKHAQKETHVTHKIKHISEDLQKTITLYVEALEKAQAAQRKYEAAEAEVQAAHGEISSLGLQIKSAINPFYSLERRMFVFPLDNGKFLTVSRDTGLYVADGVVPNPSSEIPF